MTFLRPVAVLALLVPWLAAQPAGETLPRFTPGGLEIHHINTGEGNAAFLILPDATTLLIDCGYGQAARAPKYKAPRRPDESRLPGEWVARYIQRAHPRGPGAPVNYAIVSHFHDDHMGGFMELFRHVRVERFFDRGWPDYAGSATFGGPNGARYKAALREQVDKHGMAVERIQVGAADQIRLRYAPEKYRGFEVRNIAAGGEIWTGSGRETRSRFPAGEKTDENPHSAVQRVRYGRFNYYTGGDLLGASDDAPVWRDMESAIAWVVGPVDVALLNHHGNSDGSSAFFLSVLQPRVCIANVWAARQIDPETLARLRSPRIAPGPRDIFATNGMWDGRAEHILQVFGEEIGRKHLADLKTLAADQGHIVVRVKPDGNSYDVIVLDDSNEAMRVRSVHGPYLCR